MLPSFTGTSNKKRKTTHESDGIEENDGGLLVVPQLQLFLLDFALGFHGKIPWEARLDTPASSRHVKNHVINIRESLLVLPHGTPLPSLGLNDTWRYLWRNYLSTAWDSCVVVDLSTSISNPTNLVAIWDVLKIINFGLSRQIDDGIVFKGY
ncbi:hypothetical protein BT69DRAFT_1293616 [Atractiella rhizophila]|nr:hypothetical protein BT69DRAFT_1293616 [Atractiella rhizophila]